MTDLSGRGAIVESFSIIGLYGYRDVSMSSSQGATILIARNGSGKTTLLAAMDAFLNCRFGRLSGVDFTEIRCKLAGEVEISLSAQDIEAMMLVPDSADFISFSRRVDVGAADLLDFIMNDYNPAFSHHKFSDLEVFKKIKSKFSYSTRDARRAIDKVYDSLRGRVPSIDVARDILSRRLKDVEIIYLPTYRRIELALGEPSEDAYGRRRPSVQSRLGISRKGLFNTDIQFGLGDISERLRELNGRLLYESNQGYREISANIINDMLDGSFERDTPSLVDRPGKEALALFFSRLQQGGDRFLNHFENVRIPDIDRIYNEGAETDSSNKFLNYFLGKLNSVIVATRSIEGLVEDFTSNCNAYLNAGDASVELGENAVSAYDDVKVLEIDRLTLQVRVLSKAAGRSVPMDSLSSGEKQMVSLFAKLFLYDGPKIVLIDEPELSLSIDWQRKILIDVVNAPTCAQLIAITHSPFVFDNELEPFARPLSLLIRPFSNIDAETFEFDGERDGE